MVKSNFKSQTNKANCNIIQSNLVNSKFLGLDVLFRIFSSSNDMEVDIEISIIYQTKVLGT